MSRRPTYIPGNDPRGGDEERTNAERRSDWKAFLLTHFRIMKIDLAG
jgi:hypothetical protein